MNATGAMYATDAVNAAGAANGARLLPLVVAVPLLGAAFFAVAGRRLPRVVADAVSVLVAAAPAALTLLILAGGGAHGTHGVRAPSYVVEWLGGGQPHGFARSVGIVLAADPFSLGLAALASLLVIAVLVYSWRYFEEPPPLGSSGTNAASGRTGAFPALVLLFQAGMSGFCLTGDLFDAFVFFELMGVVAYALTGLRVEEPRPVHGALAFGIVNSLGGYALLTGIGLLYARTGELGLAQIGRQLDRSRPDALVLAAFVLVTSGLLVKAAAVPFHFWLPDAHAVAPTPVCLLLSGVMVELGCYGVFRVYWTVFAGPGGVPAEAFTRALVAVGAATALLGAAMCWRQRHLKRLLAFSTVAHGGLFLAGAALLSPEGTAGTALYVLAHGGVKAALFACAGILLDRYASVDEWELHGRGRELPVVGALFLLGGLALSGLPPFGTSLGKAVAEEAAGREGHWLTAVFVVVSAVTGGAVLRAGLRVFVLRAPAQAQEGAGAAVGAAGEQRAVEEEAEEKTEAAEEAAEDKAEGERTSGDEGPETGGRLRRIPGTMLAVPLALLAGALAVGAVPELANGAGHAARLFASHGTYAAAVLDGRRAPHAAPVPAEWTGSGVLLGLLSTALGAGLALLGVRHPVPLVPERLFRPLRRLQSGHIGDYVAWATAGLAVLALLTAPGTVLR